MGSCLSGYWHVLHATPPRRTGLPARHAGDASPVSRAWPRAPGFRHHLGSKALASWTVQGVQVGMLIACFPKHGRFGPVDEKWARSGRCHPPLYAADPVRTAYVVHARPRQLSPDVSGSSGPHCVEQVDFWRESPDGRGWAHALRPCRCRNPPPRGTNPIMAMGPAGGTVFPQSSPRERVMQLGGGVRCRTSHRKLTRSDRGEISPFGQISLFGHRLLQTGLEEQAPAVCIPPGFFLLGGPLDIP